MTAGAGEDEDAESGRLPVLVLGVLGVVFGDIGTSPLYTIRECFSEVSGVDPTPANVLGILSLVFWSLTLFITVKYVMVIMRADNRGEGGILALLAMSQRSIDSNVARRAVVFLGLAGAALFYGDSAITPAISVLGAMEGLEIAAPSVKEFVVPGAIVVLAVLFLVQRHGTGKVGTLFGPIMCLWFGTLGLLGLIQIVQSPWILEALYPVYAVRFFIENKVLGFLALGAVVLAFTGGEALYADMGHFGKRPIRMAWLFVAFPALLLNYFGQGALLIHNPAAIRNPFYLMAPDWALYPLVLLATLATVIASQAVISGTFSLTRQGVLLGYWPRLGIRHTSEHEVGQIYMPEVNWTLAVVVMALVLTFESSANLATAYGIAVVGAMAVDTVLCGVVALTLWRWRAWLVILAFGAMLTLDLTFFSANVPKFASGAWFPFTIGIMMFVLMTTWRRGREVTLAKMREGELPLSSFLSRLKPGEPPRVPGTAVFLTASRDVVPTALLHNLKHNKVLHERVILLTVMTEGVPIVPERERCEVTLLGQGFWRVVVRFGFMQEPNVPRALARLASLGLEVRMQEASFFLGRDRLVPSNKPRMSRARERVYFAMVHIATDATEFFGIPSNRVVELGSQVEI